jgi:hypothetical protein
MPPARQAVAPAGPNQGGERHQDLALPVEDSASWYRLDETPVCYEHSDDQPIPLDGNHSAWRRLDDADQFYKISGA